MRRCSWSGVLVVVSIDTAAEGPMDGAPDAASSDGPQLRLIRSSDTSSTDSEQEFELSDDQIVRYEERVRMALMARYGPELGDELTAECMAWAWENQTRLATMENPVGYLVRVGQSKSRRLLRWKREPVNYPITPATNGPAWSEPALAASLATLDADSRTAIVLVHCFQWTYSEVGELLDLPLHSVRNRIHRGLHKLRDELGVDK